MTVSIGGTYKNGKIILDNKSELNENQKVTVIFESATEIQTKRKFGTLKGKISVSDDFDEPLDDLKEYL